MSMHRGGDPEHNTYRDTFSHEDRRIEIIALHTTTRRAPRGHELSRQISRGQAFKMVEETSFSWAVIVDGKRAATLRRYPSGVYYCGHAADRDIRAAALSAGGLSRKNQEPPV